MRSKVLVLLTCVVAVVAFTGCGSDDSDGSAGAGTTVPGPCPFDGTTERQTQEGVEGSTTVNKLSPTNDGCVDSITFAFAPTLPNVTAEYTGDTMLELTLTGAALGGDVKAGVTDPQGLAYVEAIDVATSGANVTITLGLDKKRPFLLNSSEVPAELELSIG